jgi:hypothetical protein
MDLVTHGPRLLFWRILLLAGLTLLAAAGAANADPAVAAPAWKLGIHHNETNFPPGGSAEYWFDLDNIGDAATSGPITLRVELGEGLTRASAGVSSDGPGAASWSCPGSPGDSVVVCTTEGGIPRHTPYRRLIIPVDIAADASGEVVTAATLQGGGAATVTEVEPTQISPDPPGFGVVPGSFAPDAFEADGLTPAREAGSYPSLLTVPIDFNSIAAPTAEAPAQKQADGTVRDLRISLPPGLVGNPTAVGVCTPAELGARICPPSSQVGRVDARTRPIFGEFFDAVSRPIFNMSAPRGTLMDLAFQINGNPIHLRASLDPSNGYAVSITAPNLNETAPLFDMEVSLWGVPADPSHDSERCGSGSIETKDECSAGMTPKPFLILPSRCGVDQSVTLSHYDSWQAPGVFGPAITHHLPGQLVGCDVPRFEPQIEVEPSGRQAATPTGLSIGLKVPQNVNPSARATPPLKDVELALPEGVTISAVAADGLTACSSGQVSLGTAEEVTCPDSSRIGEAILATPLLPHSMEGFIYMAAPRQNPFGSLFAIYVVLRDREERGVLLKLPGRLDLDPVSGRVTVGFHDLPQLPFGELSMTFRDGPRAPLSLPRQCGRETVVADLSSYAQPDSPVEVTDGYDVSEGPGGGPCLSDPGRFAPHLVVGSLNPAAGAASPFSLTLTRTDSDQALSGFTVDLPPGLIAKPAGVPLCADAAISSMARETGGAQGASDASGCPAASQVGRVTVGAGTGSEPIYLPGRVYLGGPYGGAPLSLVAVVPVLAGPFDLGTVVLRTAVFVDPSTAALRAVSDPLPTILSGVPLAARSLAIDLNRPGFMVNPTSCDPMGIGGSAISSSGANVPLGERFQVGDCARLGFKPKLALRLSGPTHRGTHPELRAVVSARRGDSNIRGVAFELPGTELLENRHIRAVCSERQFAKSACPPDSVYGHAKAWTPLLDRPLEGPVYLRESSRRLPSMVASLDGQFDLDLTARIDSPRGRLRTSFRAIPDVPLTKLALTMRGGRKGLLANTGGLCARQRRVDVGFTGQNGKIRDIDPVMKTDCG